MRLEESKKASTPSLAIMMGGGADVCIADEDDLEKRKSTFLNLPNNDKHCRLVDTINAAWIYCDVCDKQINSRTKDRKPYDISRWNEHIKSKGHQDSLEDKKAVEVARLKAKSVEALTKREKRFLEMHRRSQSDLTSFFSKRSKNSPTATEAGSLVTTTATAAPDPPPPAMLHVNSTDAATAITSKKTCMGLFKDYRDKYISLKLSTYAEFCAIDDNSEYVAGFVEGTSLTTFFSKSCTGAGYCPKKGDMWQCIPCRD